ncbi:class I SAM-dependent methyltransferase [Methyloprofundus sp.]|uniref:class I SAM-dependent methyltransferase n=1 Tax=Methyloprofundus sp. TaxID=2020875 RepID=UPI003D0FB3E1
MIFWLKKQYYQLQIKWLLKFKPALLFDKINQLDWYKNTLRLWVNDQRFSAKSKVLEAGCASGALTAYIAKSGYIPTGVDASSKMIELANKNNNGIDFLMADVLDLPFETDCFDAVIAASLVNIIPDKNKAIDELSRTCKKGGMMTILVPSAKFTDKNLHSLQESLGNSGFSAAAMEAWHKLAPKMQASDILSLFKQAGLTEITTKDYLQGMVISVSAIKPA